MRHVAYYYVFYSKKGENKMKYEFHVGDDVETQMKIEENHAE